MSINRALTLGEPSWAWTPCRVLLVACLSLLLWGSTTPQAQAADISRAVAAYKKGYELYYQKKYRLALQYFELSYQSLPEEKRYVNTRNALNFLIGDCHFQLGQSKEAYVRLKAFVTAIPAAKQKGNQQYQTAKKHLQTLRRRLNLPPPRRRVVARRTPPGPRRRVLSRAVVRRDIRRPPPPPKATRPHPMGWVLAGLGVITIAGAVITGVTAQNTMNEAHDKFDALNGTPKPFANAVSARARDAYTQSTIANVLYGVGGGITGIGVIMLFAWRTP